MTLWILENSEHWIFIFYFTKWKRPNRTHDVMPRKFQPLFTQTYICFRKMFRDSSVHKNLCFTEYSPNQDLQQEQDNIPGALIWESMEQAMSCSIFPYGAWADSSRGGWETVIVLGSPNLDFLVCRGYGIEHIAIFKLCFLYLCHQGTQVDLVTVKASCADY